MRHGLTLFLLVLACGAPATAQLVSVEISPNPVIPMPQTISVTVTESFGAGLLLPTDPVTGNPAPVVSIHLDRPGGPLDLCNGPFAVPTAPTFALGPCASVTQSVTLNCSSPGDRWLRVEYSDLGGTAYVEWFGFTMTYGSFYSPVLSALTPARIGQPLDMLLASAPQELYLVAISVTTNVGIQVNPTLFFGLDNDAALQASVVNPPPAVFVNFTGQLDAAGNSPTITVNLPFIPALVCKPLHAQGVVVDASGGARTTNVLNFSMGP